MNIEGWNNLKLKEKETRDIFDNSDIIFLIETWIGIGKWGIEEIDGFVVLHRERGRRASRGRHPGGLALYIRTELAGSITELKLENGNQEMIWIKYECHGDVLALGFVYNPPALSLIHI